MRHGRGGYRLGRRTAHRTSTLRNLAAGLFEHGQIVTTLPKAKAVQPMVEQIVTMAKQGDIASRRRIVAKLGADRMGFEWLYLRKSPKIVKHIFDHVAPRVANRAGGYTRIVKLGKHRIGDGSELVLLQFVGNEDGAEVSGRPSTRRRTADKRTAFYAKLKKEGK